MGEGNACLPAKVKTPHGHAVRGIGVGRDGKPTSLINDPVSGQDVDRGAHLSCTLIQLAGWHVQFNKQMLQSTDASLGWKNREDVKSQRCSEFESRQNQNLVANAPVLLQLALLLWLNTSQSRQQVKLLYLCLDSRAASHRIVVGDGNNVQPLHLRLAEEIQIANARLVPVGGSGSVEMQVHLVPLHLALLFSCHVNSSMVNSTPSAISRR